MHIAGKTNTVFNAISRSDVDPTSTVDKTFLHYICESDNNHGQYLNMTLVFSQSLSGNTDVVISVGQCFKNTVEIIENITFPIFVEITQE